MVDTKLSTIEQIKAMGIPIDELDRTSKEKYNLNGMYREIKTYRPIGIDEVSILAFTDEDGITRIVPNSLLIISALEGAGYTADTKSDEITQKFYYFISRAYLRTRDPLNKEIYEDITERMDEVERATRPYDLRFTYKDEQGRTCVDIRYYQGSINEHEDLSQTKKDVDTIYNEHRFVPYKVEIKKRNISDMKQLTPEENLRVLKRLSIPVDEFDRNNEIEWSLNAGKSYSKRFRITRSDSQGTIIVFTDEEGITRILPGTPLMISAMEATGYQIDNRTTEQQLYYYGMVVRTFDKALHIINKDSNRDLYVDIEDRIKVIKKATSEFDGRFIECDEYGRRFLDLRCHQGEMNKLYDGNQTLREMSIIDKEITFEPFTIKPNTKKSFIRNK